MSLLDSVYPLLRDLYDSLIGKIYQPIPLDEMYTQTIIALMETLIDDYIK